MYPDYIEAHSRFVCDTENHEMTVIRADGVNRHLRFRQPGCSAYWFDIITWPGVLCINGDMGTYVFSRIEDMFEFFKVESERHPINPGYWGEKILARDKHADIVEFDEDEFKEILKQIIADSDYDEESALAALESDVLSHVTYSTTRDDAFALAAVFEVEGERPFDDIWEYRCERFTFQYLWNCFAITYAIRKFEDHVK